MKCPNCGSRLIERIEEVMGEEFSEFVCERCRRCYNLVDEEYLRDLESIKKSFIHKKYK